MLQIKAALEQYSNKHLEKKVNIKC